MRLTGRELIPLHEVKPHSRWRILGGFLQLLLLAEGCAGALATGLELPVQPWVFYAGIAVLSAALSLLFYGLAADKERKAPGNAPKARPGRLALLACGGSYLAVLLFSGRIWRQGGALLWNCILERMNEHYGSGMTVQAVDAGVWTMTWFLLELMVPLLFLLGAVTVYRPDGILLGALLLPFLIFLLLAGGSPELAPLFLLLTGSVTVCVSARSARRSRLWGEAGSRRFGQNAANCENIRQKTVLISAAAVVILSVPGFWLIRPVLGLQLTGAEQVTAEAEGRIMGTLVNLLPRLSGGNVDLRVEGVSGGVEDGALYSADGYRMQGIEDMKLTCSAQPQETVYLKGFTGSVYEENCWRNTDGGSFDNAAKNWRIEEEPRLYIQNLPFLRALYAGQTAGEEPGDPSEAEPAAGYAPGTDAVQEMTVERINANPAYTYAPYYAYYNSYYEVECGDGYVAGQDRWQDIFSCYPRETYLELMEAWKEGEDNDSVLDDMEASYGGYVRAHDLEVPEGFEELRARCQEQGLDGSDPEDLEEITAFIQSILREEYTYRLDPPRAPEGEDALLWFVTEGRIGNSMYFASAATLMFRMFDVPARYVVGYAAPQNMFTAQPDGTYTAVLQDDNSHAWTEIYLDGVGWIPVEVTPGELVEAQDAVWQGDAIRLPEETERGDGEQAEENGPSGSGSQEGDEPGKSAWLFRGDLESVIGVLTLLLGAAALLWCGVYLLRRLRRDYGWKDKWGKRRSEGERIRDIFRAYYRRLCRLGMDPSVEASREEFRREVALRHPVLSEQELNHMLRLVFESCYSGRAMSEADVSAMRDYYRSLRKHGRAARKRGTDSSRRRRPSATKVE